MNLAAGSIQRPARANRGFTLLEVLVAVAILGLGLTAILSAQTGLFASSSYAERVSFASGLARCKLSELEIKLEKERSYPLTDITDEGNCCADDSYGGFKCKWKTEKVELPLPPTTSNLNTAGIGSGFGSGSGPPTSGLGPLGAIAAVGASSGAVLGQNPGLGDISKLLAGPSSGGPGALGKLPGGISPGLAMGGTQVLAPLVMSLVYPTLKPMLEASIRKLTVSVTWKDGSKTRDVTVTEFVTNPQMGGLDPTLPMGGLMQNPTGATTGTASPTPAPLPTGGTGFPI
jgi:general secretion pathway protein I